MTPVEEDNSRPVGAECDTTDEAKILEQQKLNNAEVFKGKDKDVSDILPSDVKQGKVGDCYLLAVLMSFANTDSGREILHKIIKSPDPTAKNADPNRYDVKFPAYENRSIVVDNSFLNDPGMHTHNSNTAYQSESQDRTGGYYGAQPGSKGVELWPMLIEKALAILAGHDLCNISNKNPEQIFYLLTKNHMGNLLETKNGKDDPTPGDFLNNVKLTLKQKTPHETIYDINDCVIGASKTSDELRTAGLKPEQAGSNCFKDPANRPLRVYAEHAYPLLKVHVDGAGNKTFDFDNPHQTMPLRGLTEPQVRRYFSSLLHGSIPGAMESPPATDGESHQGKTD